MIHFLKEFGKSMLFNILLQHAQNPLLIADLDVHETFLPNAETLNILILSKLCVSLRTD